VRSCVALLRGLERRAAAAPGSERRRRQARLQPDWRLRKRRQVISFIGQVPRGATVPTSSPRAASWRLAAVGSCRRAGGDGADVRMRAQQFQQLTTGTEWCARLILSLWCGSPGPCRCSGGARRSAGPSTNASTSEHEPGGSTRIPGARANIAAETPPRTNPPRTTCRRSTARRWHGIRMVVLGGNQSIVC
jgi:hypothetical protein